jgi:hypothetical protein
MNYSPDLLRRLIDEARRYDPQAHQRGRLHRYREAVLVQRAQGMSYERIARLFTTQGVAISAAAVGAFCRRFFTSADLERARTPAPPSTAAAPALPTPRPAAPAPGAPAAAAVSPYAPRPGPRISRDVY